MAQPVVVGVLVLRPRHDAHEPRRSHGIADPLRRAPGGKRASAIGPSFRGGQPAYALVASLAASLFASCAMPGFAYGQPVFPAGSAIGLVPPPGYEVQDGTAGFAAQDGSGAITLAEAPLPYGNLSRANLLAQLALLSDRRLAALGVGQVRRRTIETPAFFGSLAQGTHGTGADLQTVWSLYFVGTDAMGNVSWRVAGAVAADQVAESERVFLTVVTRPQVTLAGQLSTLPFTVDTTLHDLIRVFGPAVTLASRDRDDQVVVAVLPAPAVQDRAVALRGLLDHPLLRAVVRDPVWDETEQGTPILLAGQAGSMLHARVTHTPTGKPMRLVLRTRFLADDRVLLVMGCAPAPNDAAFAAAETRFTRIADSVALR